MIEHVFPLKTETDHIHHLIRSFDLIFEIVLRPLDMEDGDKLIFILSKYLLTLIVLCFLKMSCKIEY